MDNNGSTNEKTLEPSRSRMDRIKVKSATINRILAEAVAFERGESASGKRADSPDNGSADSEGRKGRTLATLEVAARESGVWINNLSELVSPLASPFPHGQECEVYLAEDCINVIKLNNLSIVDGVGAFLERISLHNIYFPDTEYTIIGFAGNSSGETCFVLEQPFVPNVREATKPEISDFFKRAGWYEIFDSEYTDGVVEIWDQYPKNVLTDDAGTLYFIDVNFDYARPKFRKLWD